MRILVFSTDDFLPPTGGAEIAIEEITKRLNQHSFVLICAKLRRESSRHQRIGNVEIYRLGFGIPKIDGIILALFGAIKAKSLSRNKPFDLIWSVLASYGGFAAVSYKRYSNLPFLLTLQEGSNLVKIERKSILKFRFRRIFKFADALQPISSYLRDWGLRMGFKGKYSEVIPNGVDFEVFNKSFSDAEINNKKESLGIPKDVKLVITTSRLERKNGLLELVESFKHLSNDVHLLVCGLGSLENELRRMAKDFNIDDRIHFLGFVNRFEIPLYLRMSDIFIRPSRSEGFGNSFIEAMAARIPVIGTNVGGIPDFLVDGQTGFFCTNDPLNISQAIEKVLNMDSVSLNNVLDNAEILVKEKYDWNLVAHKMEKLFNNLITNG